MRFSVWRWLALVILLVACTRPDGVDVEAWPLHEPVTPMSTIAFPVVSGLLTTPTPLPVRQVPETITVFHTVARGETLFSIAQRYAVTVDSLIALNALANPDALAVGQVLQVSQVPSRTAPAHRLLPDSELVYGPGYVGFSVAEVTARYSGWFNQYGEEIEGRWYSASEVVELVARQYSVGPRVLLALLELRGGWLTNPAPSPEARMYPLGYEREYWDGLYLQLSLAANGLNRGFYGWVNNSLWVVQLDSGEYVQLSSEINAGTAGVQCALLFGQTYDAWEASLNPNDPQGFLMTYRTLFGDPFSYAVEPLLPLDGATPLLALPWPRGETWYYTGGPHGGWDAGSAWAALDFVPGTEPLGCTRALQRATAAAPGLIVYSDHGMVLQDLDGDGFAGTGWVLLYLHIATEGRVPVGAALQTGDPIGHPSCEGGVSYATHLHFARRFNGVWIAAEHPQWPLVMDGWRAGATERAYSGTLTRNGEVRTACECWEPTNAIQHTGLNP